MARKINTYGRDGTPELEDKVIGSDVTGETFNYTLRDILDLQDTKYNKVDLVFEYANTANPLTEENDGVFSADTDTISAVTEIKINKLSYNGDDVTEFMDAIEATLVDNSVVFNLKNTSDSSNFGGFSVSSIVNNTTTFTITGVISGSFSNGSFTDGDIYFMSPNLFEQGIANLVEDATPQLGGNLDENGKYLFIRERAKSVTVGDIIAPRDGLAGAIVYSQANADGSHYSGKLGIALSTVVSSTTIDILTRGIYTSVAAFTGGANYFLDNTNGGITLDTSGFADSDYIQFIGYAIDDDNLYFDPSASWVSTDGLKVNGITISGVTDFESLTDTPLYAGQALKHLIVNAGENGIEYVAETATAVYNEVITPAASTWNINHALGTTSPNIEIYNSLDERIDPTSLDVVDSNNFTVGFGSAIEGRINVLGGITLGSTTNLSAGTRTATTIDVNSSDGTNATLVEADTTNAGILGSDKWDEIVANTIKSTNVPTSLSVGTVGIDTVAITSDGGADDVTLPAAIVSAAGMLTTAKWGEIVANNAKVTNVSTDLSEGTTTNTTVDVNSSDGTNATLVAASTSRAGVMTKAKFDEVVVNNAKISLETDSVTEVKLFTKYKDVSVISASEVDWDDSQTYTKTLSGNTTFTFANLYIGVKSMYLTGNFTLALPTGFTLLPNSDAYDGTKTCKLEVECYNTSTPLGTYIIVQTT